MASADVRLSEETKQNCEATEESAEVVAKKIENEDENVGIAPLEDAQEMEYDEAEEQGELVYGAPEARNPAVLAEPHLPTPKEREEHNITHCPYRSWCSVYVQAAGREDAHIVEGYLR